MFVDTSGKVSDGAADVERDGPTQRGLILVVDDDPNDWEIYGKILWYNGFDVLYAANGASARMLAEKHSPDLILLDLMLPDANGLDLCVDFRARERLAKTPVILLSGRPAAEFAARAADAGCAHYVEKPASPVQILHLVEDLIGRPPPAGVGPTPTKFPPHA